MTANEIPESTLPPYPDGWYAVGMSRDLKPGALMTKRIAGRDIVVFRTESGVAHAVNAHCPHMGAHFGKGGAVVGELIRCPFHHFDFNRQGDCTATGYGTKPPPACRLPTWHLAERQGFVIVYWDNEGRAPDWQVPDWDNTGWTPIRSTTFELKSHPQETTENSVDVGHFGILHGYQDVVQLEPLSIEGAYLTVRYGVSRDGGFFGKDKIRSEFEVHVHGLGFSFVEPSAPDIGLNFRTWVLPRPLDPGRIELRVGFSVKYGKLTGINPAMALMPKKLGHRIISWAAFRAYCHDVGQDFEVWENKLYLDKPVLAAGDGPLGRYRKYCRQFYPELRAEPLRVVDCGVV